MTTVATVAEGTATRDIGVLAPAQPRGDAMKLIVIPVGGDLGQPFMFGSAANHLSRGEGGARQAMVVSTEWGT